FEQNAFRCTLTRSTRRPAFGKNELLTAYGFAKQIFRLKNSPSVAEELGPRASYSSSYKKRSGNDKDDYHSKDAIEYYGVRSRGRRGWGWGVRYSGHMHCARCCTAAG